MSSPHGYIADGSLAGCRWYIQRPPDMTRPMVLLTLQVWDQGGVGNLQTSRQELPLPAAGQKAWLAAQIDRFLCQVEANDSARRIRAAKKQAS